ncbi:ThiP ABC-type Fe3+ transport system, permease component [Paracoccaceae bacterium]
MTDLAPLKTGGIGAVLRRLSPLTVYLWLLALVILPNILLFGTSFLKSSGGVLVYEVTLANYGRTLASGTVQLLILRTILTAFAAALVAALIAFPLAFYVSRYMKRWKVVAVMLVVVPLWISLLMRVFAWRIILGENGVLNSFLVSTGVLEVPSDAFLYSRFAVILTLAYMAIPYVFVSSYTALERVPQSLIEASQDSGAGLWNTFRNVVWPLSKQGLAIGFALAFLLAVGDYITPSMVGGLDGTMLGMVIASQFGMAGNWPLGAAQSVVLIGAVSLVLGVIFWLARSRGILQSVDAGTGAEMRAPQSLRDHVVLWLVRVAVVLPYLFLYLPLIIITVFSFNASQIQTLPLTGFTLDWYAALWGDQNLIDAFQRTMVVALVTVALSVVVGIVFAMVFAYRALPFAGLVQTGLAIPVAIPGIVLGISIVIAAQLLGIKPGIWRVIIGHMTFVMPVVMLIILNRLQRLDPSYVQASLDLGANYGQTFRHVLFPMIRTAVLGGALLGFTLSVDEVIVTLFLTGIEPTLPIYVWNQMRFGFTPSVNAIFTLIGVASVALILIAMIVIGPDREKAKT